MQRAPGVEYSAHPLMPGQLVFRGERLSATLWVQICTGMWQRANQGKAPTDSLLRCRGCPVGAVHDGSPPPNHHRLRGTTTCARCHRGDLRLIGGRICVSCSNREREWLKGANAKGRFPSRHPALERMAVTASVGGVTQTVVRERVTGTVEIVVELLRDSPGRVVFGLARVLPVVGTHKRGSDGG